MPYVTHIELSERPGARELAQVASAEHEAIVEAALMDATLRGTDRTLWSAELVVAADAALARIDDAVTEADGIIDGFLAKRGYALPLSPVPSVVSAWSRAISRYLLHKGRISDERTDPIARDYRDALKLLALTAEGKFSLGATDPVVVSSSTDVRFAGDANVFGRDELRHFR